MADANPFASSSSEDDVDEVVVQAPSAGAGAGAGAAAARVEDLPQDLQDKYARLKEQEKRLDAREANFDEREQILWEREKSVAPKRPANWPPCKPVVRHQIDEDIPETWQRLVKAHYIEFMVWCVLCLYNLVAVSAGAATGGLLVGDPIIGVIFLLILVPFHFVVYRFLLYQGIYKQSSAILFLWFVLRGLEVLSYGYFALGFPGSGAGGFWNMGNAFEQSDVAGIMILVSAILFCILFAGSLVGFIMVRARYSELGGLSKARDEARSAAIQAAKDNPDLVAEGAKMGAQAAKDNPDLVVSAAKAGAGAAA